MVEPSLTKNRMGELVGVVPGGGDGDGDRNYDARAVVIVK